MVAAHEARGGVSLERVPLPEPAASRAVDAFCRMHQARERPSARLCRYT
jgi:hypothetical protein